MEMILLLLLLLLSPANVKSVACNAIKIHLETASGAESRVRVSGVELFLEWGLTLMQVQTSL